MNNEQLLQIQEKIKRFNQTGSVEPTITPQDTVQLMDQELQQYRAQKPAVDTSAIDAELQQYRASQQPQPTKDMGFGEGLAYSTAKPFAKLGLSIGNAIPQINIPGTDLSIGGGLNEAGQALSDQYNQRGYDVDINSAREAIGTVLEAGATTFTGEAAFGAGKNAIQSVAKGTAPGIKAVLPLAGSGAIQGAAQGVSEALQDDEQSVGNYLSKSLLYGAVGGVANPLLQVGVPQVIKGVTKLFKPTPIVQDLAGNAFTKEQSKLIEGRKKILDPIASKYVSVSRFRDNAMQKYGFDPLDWLVKTDILSGSTDDTGSLIIRGEGNALDKFRKFVEPQEGVVSAVLENEGKALPATVLQNELLEVLNKNYKFYGLTSEQLAKADDKIAALSKGIQRKAGSVDIPLSIVHDEKIALMNPLNYNAESRAVDKAVANALKEIVEKNTDSVDVREVNKALQKYYIIEDFLEKLDGKKIEGGKLGKYFAQGLGAAVGSNFGPFGTIAGAELGGAIKGAQFENALAGELGGNIPVPKVISNASKVAKTPKDPFEQQIKSITKAQEDINASMAQYEDVANFLNKEERTVAIKESIGEAQTHEEILRSQLDEMIPERQLYLMSQKMKEGKFNDNSFNARDGYSKPFSGADFRKKQSLANERNKYLEALNEQGRLYGYDNWDQNADLANDAANMYKTVRDSYNNSRKQVREMTKLLKQDSKKRLISEEAYQAAKKRFDANMKRINSGIPVDQIKDFGIMAAYHIESGILTAAELGKKLAQEGYKFTKEQVQNIFDIGKSQVDDQLRGRGIKPFDINPNVLRKLNREDAFLMQNASYALRSKEGLDDIGYKDLKPLMDKFGIDMNVSEKVLATEIEKILTGKRAFTGTMKTSKK